MARISSGRLLWPWQVNCEKTLKQYNNKATFSLVTRIYVSGVYELHDESPSARPNIQVEVESTIKLVFDKETTNKMTFEAKLILITLQ